MSPNQASCFYVVSQYNCFVHNLNNQHLHSMVGEKIQFSDHKTKRWKTFYLYLLQFSFKLKSKPFTVTTINLKTPEFNSFSVQRMGGQ